MRILLIPRIDRYEVNGDSAFQLLWRMVPLFKMMDKKAFFYLLVPRGVEDEGEFSRYDNLKVLYENRDITGMHSEYKFLDNSYLHKMFNMSVGQYPIDLCITSKVEHALNVELCLRDYYRSMNEDMAYIPTIVFHPWVPAEEFGYFMPNDRRVAWLVPSLLSYMVFATELEYNDFVDSARNFLSGSSIRKLIENSKVMYGGVDTFLIDKYYGSVGKREKFTLFTTGLTTSNKRIDFIFKVWIKLYEMGYDFNFVMTTPNDTIEDGNAKKLYEKYKGIIDVRFNASKDTYLRSLLSSHCWVGASEEERTGLKFLEMMYSGVVGVVCRREWSEMAFGKDYWLFYEPDDMNDAISKILYVYSHYDEAKAKALEIRKAIYENKSSFKFADGMEEMMKERYFSNVRDKRLLSDGQSFSSVYDEALKSFVGCEFMLSDFIKEAKARMKKNVQIEKGFSFVSPGLWDIYQWLKTRRGVEDKYDSEYPVLVYRGGK